MGMRYALAEKPLAIGRGEDCDIRISDHSVSRRHARIETTAEGVSVTDQGSTNGTFVNDRMIQGTVSMQDGDYLRIGNCIYRFLAGGNIEAEYHEEIYRLTIIDALTQTHNQRSLLEFLDRELVRSNRHGRPLALVMFDIDFFKNVNDQLGHLAGDMALREAAQRVDAHIRGSDAAARFGGDEFVVLAPGISPEQAAALAERIRQAVCGTPLEISPGLVLNLTVSIGVAGINLARSDGDLKAAAERLLAEADAALYRAKQRGRNRVELG